jgi:hypothetical protein
MLALCTAVTLRRPLVRAWRKANSEMRWHACSVTIFRLSATPGTTMCSMPE